jgi:Ca2+-binding EF-hand superfamily protein
MRKKARSDDQETELKDAFRVLDKEGQGWIDTMQMQQIVKVRAEPLRTQACSSVSLHALRLAYALRSPLRAPPRTTTYRHAPPHTTQALGEDLSEEEVKAMISEAISNYEGKVYYDGFVKTMIANS